MKTIVETNTGKLLFSTDNDNYICLENQTKIDIHLTEMFVSPFLIFKAIVIMKVQQVKKLHKFRPKHKSN